MKESWNTVKTEFKAKLESWNKIESRWLKLVLIALFLLLVLLKIFTTVLTFDWLAGLFS